MNKIDIAQLSLRERLDLIGQLWESLDDGQVPLTAAQAAELDHRMLTLDEDVKEGSDADQVIAELRSRLR